MSKLHIHLLIALRAAGKFGCAADDMLTDMRHGSHRDLSTPDLDRALRDLADKSLAATFTTVLESKRWRITELGKSALEEAGL